MAQPELGLLVHTMDEQTVSSSSQVKLISLHLFSTSAHKGANIIQWLSVRVTCVTAKLC